MTMLANLKKNKGQSMIETAITLPIILLIMFFMISVGIMIYNKTVFMMAANKALDAGVGALNRQQSPGDVNVTLEGSVKEAAEKAAADVISAKLLTEEINVTTKLDEKKLTVIVSGNYKFTLPFLHEIFGDKNENGFDIVSQCTYQYEEGE